LSFCLWLEAGDVPQDISAAHAVRDIRGSGATSEQGGFPFTLRQGFSKIQQGIRAVLVIRESRGSGQRVTQSNYCFPP
jgi:hypothetical protein